MAKRNGHTTILTKRNLYESVRQKSIFNEKAWGRILGFGLVVANRESIPIYIYIFLGSSRAAGPGARGATYMDPARSFASTHQFIFSTIRKAVERDG